MKHKINDRPERIIWAIDTFIIGFKAYRNREILKDHYILGMTFEEVAEKYDMSDRQIKKICYDYEPTIIEHLRVEE